MTSHCKYKERDIFALIFWIKINSCLIVSTICQVLRGTFCHWSLQWPWNVTLLSPLCSGGNWDPKWERNLLGAAQLKTALHCRCQVAVSGPIMCSIETERAKLCLLWCFGKCVLKTGELEGHLPKAGKEVPSPPLSHPEEGCDRTGCLWAFLYKWGPRAHLRHGQGGRDPGRKRRTWGYNQPAQTGF